MNVLNSMKRLYLFLWLIFRTQSLRTTRSVIKHKCKNSNRLFLKQEKEIIGRFTILSEEEFVAEEESFSDSNDCIFLSDTSSGWGNGKHPTTKLCLDFINENLQEGCSFLDYGTGSGILSIFAAKMGASKVLAGNKNFKFTRYYHF